MIESATKGRGRASIIASTTQVVLSGAVLFVVFRYLYFRLGIEQIGIWSLVLSTTSISRIGELGLSAGVVRFVAQALKRGDTQRAADIVQTVCLALAVIMGALLLALYPLCAGLIRRLVPPAHEATALGILPYALVSLWINVAASVFSGALDGCHRLDLRSFATGASHLVFLALVVVLTPDYGLVGVALAQLWQAIGLAAVTWVLLRRELRALPLLPTRWRNPLLREMMGYGLSFQAISIMNLLFEPVVKALLGKFGGLASLGFYEMANKLLLQGRSVIVEAGRILVPSIATMGHADAAAARELFIVSYRLTFFVSVMFYGLLGTLLSSISLVWLGRLEPQFLFYALILNFGWFVNTLIGPAYFSNLGSGKLRDNVVSHVIMSLVASTAGWVLGYFMGGMGVVFGTMLGLISGSLYLLITYMRREGFDWPRIIVPDGLLALVLLSAVLCMASQGYAMWQPGTLSTLAAGAVSALLLLGAGWRNSLRHDLLKGAP